MSRRPTASRATTRPTGFTLLEVPVALLLGALVMLAAITVLHTHGAVVRRAADRVDALSEARWAMAVIRQDLELAGAAPRATVVEGLAEASADRVTIQADLDGDGSIDVGSRERLSLWWNSDDGGRILRRLGSQSMALARNVPVGGLRLRYLDSTGADLLPIDAGATLNSAARAAVRTVVVEVSVRHPAAPGERDRVVLRSAVTPRLRRQGRRRKRRGRRSNATRETHRMPRGEGGLALLAAVVLAGLLGAALSASLWLVRSELWVAGSARADAQARLSAEAAVQHAMALLAQGSSFAPLLDGDGTGGLAWPGAAGPLLGSGGGRVPFPGAPFGYDVVVEPAVGMAGALRPSRVALVARADAVRGVRRTIRATIGREATPLVPGALVVDRGSVEVTGGRPLVVAGELAPAAGATDVAAAVAVGSAGARDAIAALSASGAIATSGAQPLAVVAPADLADVAAGSGLVLSAADTLETSFDAGPASRRVSGGRTPRLIGVGVVVAEGDLRIDGPLEFSGVVLVDGILHLRGAPCTLRGMLWVRQLVADVGCMISLDRPAIVAADLLVPLPRRPVLLAMVDEESPP